MEEKEIKVELTENLESEIVNIQSVEKNEIVEKEHSDVENITDEVDWNSFSKEEIVEKVKNYINNFPVNKIKNIVELAKSEFYKKHNEELDILKAKYIESGESEGNFKPMPDKIEEDFKQYLSIFRQKKQELNNEIESKKTENLKKKEEIVKKIKDLVNSTETMNTSFQEFKLLQEQFNNAGAVPTKDDKQIWSAYHLALETFYDYVKINRELRDLDLKKNLTYKIEIIEKAKTLIDLENVLESHKKLQELHEKWREIGPVQKEQSETVWKEFSEITKTLNKKHQEFFDNLKDEKENNLKAKENICEKVEEITKTNYDKLTDWNQKTEEITELQKQWNEVGFTPKNTNNKIFKRFREACDKFFENKKEFYGSIKDEQQINLQKKYELCEKAETLQNNTDWKKTSDEFIKLQKQWKEIGPVPRKKSDLVWARFRTACDTFFNTKENNFAGNKQQENENLIQKQELLTEIENYQHSEKIDETLDKLKEFQAKWKEIGFVPLKEKAEIQTKYNGIINKHFDNLKVDVKKRDELRFNSKLEEFLEAQNPMDKLLFEKDKYIKKVMQLENDAILLENNMGFFGKSKGADELLKNVKKQLESITKEIELQKEKVKQINKFINKIKK